jgi:hypothetical protein
MKYETKPILSGDDKGRTKRCRHGAKPYEHCSACDAGKLHVISLTDEEQEVMIRALTFAADFQDDYYTLYPGQDYNSGNDRKQANGERILADLRATLAG